jgi:hypothetical protein
LYRLNILNRFKTEFEPRRPTLYQWGPPVGDPPPRCLAYPSSSRTPPLTIGPRCCPTPPVSHAAPRRPCPAALPFPHNSAAARTRWPGAVAGHVLHPASHPPPPHFPLSFLPVCPLIWTSHRCLTLLRSASELELISFSIAYASTSPALAIGDPSSSLVPARAPPSSAIIGEHDHTLSLHPN